MLKTLLRGGAGAPPVAVQFVAPYGRSNVQQRWHRSLECAPIRTLRCCQGEISFRHFAARTRSAYKLIENSSGKQRSAPFSTTSAGAENGMFEPCFGHFSTRVLSRNQSKHCSIKVNAEERLIAGPKNIIWRRSTNGRLQDHSCLSN